MPQVPRRRTVRFRNRGASLGLRATRTEDLISQVERGLRFKALESFSAQQEATETPAQTAAEAARATPRLRAYWQKKPPPEQLTRSVRSSANHSSFTHTFSSHTFGAESHSFRDSATLRQSWSAALAT